MEMTKTIRWKKEEASDMDMKQDPKHDGKWRTEIVAWHDGQ